MMVHGETPGRIAAVFSEFLFSPGRYRRLRYEIAL